MRSDLSKLYIKKALPKDQHKPNKAEGKVLRALMSKNKMTEEEVRSKKSFRVLLATARKLPELNAAGKENAIEAVLELQRNENLIKNLQDRQKFLIPSLKTKEDQVVCLGLSKSLPLIEYKYKSTKYFLGWIKKIPSITNSDGEVVWNYPLFKKMPHEDIIKNDITLIHEKIK
ncbi:MAG: hypothetical protein ABIP51_01720 [Bacteroidia bacterium]